MSITASDARKQLFPLIEQVNNDRVAVEITSRRGNAVLISAIVWFSVCVYLLVDFAIIRGLRAGRMRSSFFYLLLAQVGEKIQI